MLPLECRAQALACFTRYARVNGKVEVRKHPDGFWYIVVMNNRTGDECPVKSSNNRDYMEEEAKELAQVIEYEYIAHAS